MRNAETSPTQSTIDWIALGGQLRRANISTAWADRLTEELHGHFEDTRDAALARGLSAREADHEAIRSLGLGDDFVAACRSVHGCAATAPLLSVAGRGHTAGPIVLGRWLAATVGGSAITAATLFCLHTLLFVGN
ncbi:MAG: hypothetical protein AAGC71_09550 [Pseudomonadota bacterium]